MPSFAETFDTIPLTGWTCFGVPVATTDGASEGPSSLRIDPYSTDSYITNPSVPLPGDGNWIYTSFALYVPSWSAMWDGGNGWDPNALTFRHTPGGLGQGVYVQPQSASTGTLEVNFGGGSFADSTLIPDGAWAAVEVARMFDGGTFQSSFEFWVNGVDSGVFTTTGGGGGSTVAATLGDQSWGASTPLTALRFLLDDFRWDTAGRIGPVDLSAAFYHGWGSGVERDPCTGTIIPPTPPSPLHPIFDGSPSHKAS